MVHKRSRGCLVPIAAGPKGDPGSAPAIRVVTGTDEVLEAQRPGARRLCHRCWYATLPSKASPTRACTSQIERSPGWHIGGVPTGRGFATGRDFASTGSGSPRPCNYIVSQQINVEVAIHYRRRLRDRWIRSGKTKPWTHVLSARRSTDRALNYSTPPSGP